MAELPPGVSSYLDRYGKRRYRFRMKGLMPCGLPDEPGQPQFQEAYEAARAGRLRPVGRRAPPDARTVHAAWLHVQSSIEWQQLRRSSQAQQRGVAERFLQTAIGAEKTTFGQMPFAGIRRGDIKKILARYADRPHAGEAVLRLLRKLSLVALDLEWIDADPTYRVRFRPKLIGHRAWTDEELAQFAQKWPLASRERLAFALALYTGQRRADVAAMASGAYDGRAIAVTQEKTGAPLWIPLHPDLKVVLDARPAPGPWLLMNAAERRYATASLGNMMADAISAAGLPDDCRLHGLRKSAGRCLAEAGCTARQIMAILGHKTLSEAQRYTDAADQKRLAQQAIDQWAKPRLGIIVGGK